MGHGLRPANGRGARFFKSSRRRRSSGFCRRSWMPPNRRLFPPPGQARRQSKGTRGLDVLTAGGEVRLKRKYFWSSEAGGSCPADALVGVDQSNVTPGARQLCCLMAIGQDFDQASRDLLRVGGLSVSRERLRQITEKQAAAVQKTRDNGELPAAWLADQAKLPEGSSRVYGGV